MVTGPSESEPLETEREYLDRYRKERGRYASAGNTVDVAILAVVDGRLSVLLVQRGRHPFRGRWALPGGFIELGDGGYGQGEDLEAAARRELREETGVDTAGVTLTQLRTYADPFRDPRGRTISTVFIARLPTAAEPVAGDDAADARLFPLDAVLGSDGPELAFDHAVILHDVQEWAARNPAP